MGLFRKLEKQWYRQRATQNL